MYHGKMTIKHRLFFSNIRMVIIAFVIFAFITRIMTYIMVGTPRPDREATAYFFDTTTRDFRLTLWFILLILFMILISIINSILTHRFTKHIIKQLEPLSAGVNQIQKNNLSYRINHKSDDEFLPICEAFNEMSEKLETSIEEKKKDEANRKELIAGISHDLRTPLTSIKGCVEGIETGVASTPEMQKKYLSIIKNKASVMEHIIEQLFLFSKLDMNEFPLFMRRVDIGLAVSDMIEDSAPEYENRGLSVALAEIPQNIYINADVFMLKNVIINILENSVKYKTKEHGQIKINIMQNDGYVFLRMTDNGPGVQAEMLPSLFDIFYRTDPSRSNKGSGLGLAISAKIIERMNGQIFAELPSDGGLSIVVKLPLLQGES